MSFNAVFFSTKKKYPFLTYNVSYSLLLAPLICLLLVSYIRYIYTQPNVVYIFRFGKLFHHIVYSRIINENFQTCNDHNANINTYDEKSGVFSQDDIQRLDTITYYVYLNYFPLDFSSLSDLFS